VLLTFNCGARENLRTIEKRAVRNGCEVSWFMHVLTVFSPDIGILETRKPQANLEWF